MNQAPPNGPRPEVREAVRGYVAGYNRYLRETGVANLPDPACRGEAWVREIEEIDAYRRFYQLALLASAGVAINGIGGAQPPAPGATSGGPPPQAAEAASQLAEAFPLDIGSNAYGIGREQTDNGKGLLLGNPHFPWDGTERFYQAHATIPGQDGRAGRRAVRRAGRAHRQHARARVEPHRLDRVPLHAVRADARPRLADDVPRRRRSRRRWSATSSSSTSSSPTGRSRQQTRTLYTTSTGRCSPSCSACRCSRGSRARRSRWATPTRTTSATSTTSSRRTSPSRVREYDQVLRRNQGIPWVNSIAADSSGEAYYADISVVPHVTNEHAEQCNTVARARRRSPRSACRCSTARARRASGAATRRRSSPGRSGPSEHLPSMFRTDYVMNSNDSYWLGNLKQRLEGFPRIVGDEKTERTLRTRLGLLMVDGQKFSQRKLQDTVFNNRQYAGELWRDALLPVCDSTPGYGRRVRGAARVERARRQRLARRAAVPPDRAAAARPRRTRPPPRRRGRGSSARTTR